MGENISVLSKELIKEDDIKKIDLNTLNGWIWYTKKEVGMYQK